MVFLVYPSHVLSAIKNLKEGKLAVQISVSQFSRVHYDQPNNKTIKYMKGPVYFVNCSSDEYRAGARWQESKLPNI